MDRMSMKRDNAKISLEIAIAYLGALAVLITIMSGGGVAFNLNVELILVLVLIVAVSLVYESVIWKYVRFIYPGICVLIVILNWNSICKACFYAGKLIQARLYLGANFNRNNYLESNANIYKDMMTSQGIFAIILSIIIAYLMVLIVKKSSMIMSILAVVPFLVAFTMLGVVPNVWAFVFCAIFVFAIAGLRNNVYGYVNSCKIIAIGFCVSIISLFFIRPGDYVRPDLFISFGAFLGDNFSVFTVVNEEVESEDGGFVNSGKVGDKEKIVYSGLEQAVYTAMPTDKAKYIPTFYGNEFIVDEKCWQEDEYADINDNSGSEMQGTIKKIKESYYVKEYIAGNKDIKEAFSIYKQTIRILESNRISGGYSANVSSEALKAMYNLSNGINTNIAEEDRKQFAYKKATKYYGKKETEVPEKYKEIFNIIFGEVNITSYDDIKEYIENVKDYFQTSFTYTTAPGKIPDDKDFMEYFLMESKEGYCTYYATAATLMFRYAGIPARYVEGWAISDDRLKSGNKTSMIILPIYEFDDEVSLYKEAYEIKLKDSDGHAWVEIYIDGYGWTTVEVTPTVGERLVAIDGNSSISDIEDNSEVKEQSSTELSEENQQLSTEIIEEEIIKQSTQESDEVEDIKEDKKFLNINLDEPLGDMIFLKGISKIVKTKAFGVVVSICIAVLIIVYVISRYTKIKKLKEIYEEGTPKEVVAALERLLEKTQYYRPVSRDYLDYARYLEKNYELFSKYEYRQLVEMAMKERFGAGIDKGEKKYYNQILRSEIIMLRKEIIEEHNIIKQIIIKYIQVR